MNRELHQLVQGSEEWIAFRALHFGASEAGAMLGISPKTTRDELLRLKHLGLGKKFSAYVLEKVIEPGHEVEALALPHAEAIVGKELYQVTMSMGKLSASCDGLSFDDEDAFEHKRWNEPMAELMRQGIVPPEHMPQCQQVLMVTGAKRLLFMLSDGTPERMLHVWVYPDTVMFDQLKRGWAQFERDLADYVLPAAAAPQAVGRAPETLPSVVLEIKGEVVSSNLLAVKTQAVAVFEGINRDLQTDQDFADAAVTVSWCNDIESRLKAAKAHALGQAKSIDEVFTALDEIIAASATARLALTKLVDRRKEERKGEIVATGVKALRDHMHELNEKLGRNLMPTVVADFATAIKNRRSFENMAAAVNAEAARAKTAATEIFERIDANVKSLHADGNDWEFLFPDMASACQKPTEDFANLLTARVAKHNERIKAEADAKLKREADERAAEETRIAAEAEEKRPADEAQAKREADALIAAQRKPMSDREWAALPAGDRELPHHLVYGSAAEPAQPAQTPQQELTLASAPPCDQADVVDAEVPRRFVGSRPAEKPTLKLGDINARIEVVSVSADQLAKLGFTATVDRGARLYRESDYPRMCTAIARHMGTVALGAATA